MSKTNFDLFLEEQLRDPDFAERFKRAGEAWDVALQLAALREEAGLSQLELARKLRTTQQQISRLESPSYEGHSLSMLRRVARVLNAHVRVVFLIVRGVLLRARHELLVDGMHDAPLDADDHRLVAGVADHHPLENASRHIRYEPLVGDARRGWF